MQFNVHINKDCTVYIGWEACLILMQTYSIQGAGVLEHLSLGVQSPPVVGQLTTLPLPMLQVQCGPKGIEQCETNEEFIIPLLVRERESKCEFHYRSRLNYSEIISRSSTDTCLNPLKQYCTKLQLLLNIQNFFRHIGSKS